MGLTSRYRKYLELLPKDDRTKLFFAGMAQSLLSILDLIGVAVIGFLGALTVAGIQSRPPAGLISEVLSLAQISEFSFQTQAAVLGTIAGGAFVSRTLLSIFLTRRILFFLSIKGAQISSVLLRKFLSQSVSGVRSGSTQESIHALTHGVNTITLGVIGNLINLLSDFSLLIVLFVGLLIVDIKAATSTLAFFVAIGVFLHKILHKRALKLGITQTKLSVESNEQIAQIVHGYREAFVRNRRIFYAKKISELRYRLSRALAEASFMPYIGKYVIETAVTVGALGISALQFIQSDAVRSVGVLSIFLAAGTRIAPAVLRMQQGALSLKSAEGASQTTFEMIDQLTKHEGLDVNNIDIAPDFRYEDFNPKVELKNVNFKYDQKSSFGLTNVSFQVNPGEFVAIVGESGSGKSTVADIILGLQQPDQGEVLISGISPEDAIKEWPGGIGYVPQEPMILNGTIQENVQLGYDSELISDERVNYAVKSAQLEDFVSGLPEGLATIVGEGGSKISGGQKQRIGLARALVSKPKLIVLDEATSALDGDTEEKVVQTLVALHGEVTLIVIAHRLSTVVKADKVILVKNGEVQALGNFEEIRSQVSEFDAQAKKMGL